MSVDTDERWRRVFHLEVLAEALGVSVRELKRPAVEPVAEPKAIEPQIVIVAPVVAVQRIPPVCQQVVPRKVLSGRWQIGRAGEKRRTRVA